MRLPVLHHELILERAARELAGSNHQRCAPRQAALPALDGMFDQLPGAQIPPGDFDCTKW